MGKNTYNSKMSLHTWPTFVRKFVTENFQKLTKNVTLFYLIIVLLKVCHLLVVANMPDANIDIFNAR